MNYSEEALEVIKVLESGSGETDYEKLKNRSYEDNRATVAAGKLGEYEVKLLNEGLKGFLQDKNIQESLKNAKNNKIPFWVNVMQGGYKKEEDMPSYEKHITEITPHYEELVKLSTKLMNASGITKTKEPILDGFCYIFMPPEAKGQFWHLDANLYSSVCIVSLSDSVPETATDYLDATDDVMKVLHQDVEQGKISEIDIRALLDKCPNGVLSIRKAYTLPHTPYYLKYGTIHRGAGNPSDKWRVAFIVQFAESNEYFGVPEPVACDDRDYDSQVKDL